MSNALDSLRSVGPRDADLPRPAPQSRGGAGASRRHPGEQRGLRPGVELPQAGAFLRRAAWAHLRPRREADLGGKRATPITLKTFFQGDEPVGELTVPQYLGRLAANATTIINAEDYGRTIYDLAIRRQPDPDRRGHGQHRLRCADRCAARGADRGRRAEALRARRDREVRLGLRALHHRAHRRHRHGGQRLSARRRPVGARHRLHRSRRQDGRLAALRPDHRRRTPVHGQDGARHQHRLSRGADLSARPEFRGTRSTAPWSASSRSKCRPSSSPPASSPSSPISPRSASAAAASSPRSSTASSRSPRSSRTCLFISTRPAASPWPSSPRARGG